MAAVERVAAAVLLQGNATTSNTREVATRDLSVKAAVIRKLLLDTVFCEDCAVLMGLRVLRGLRFGADLPNCLHNEASIRFWRAELRPTRIRPQIPEKDASKDWFCSFGRSWGPRMKETRRFAFSVTIQHAPLRPCGLECPCGLERKPSFGGSMKIMI